MKNLRRWMAALAAMVLLATGEAAFLTEARAEDGTIPAPVTEEFTSADGWTYRLTAEGEAVLTGFADVSAERLELPKAVDGHWVAAVGENAFAEHTQVRSLRAPASIRGWAGSAFAHAEGVTVEAYNGSAALGFARQRGFRASNLSGFDFFEDVADLSEISSGQFSYSGSKLTVQGPWARLLKEGQKIYLPPSGSYPNGIPLRTGSVSLRGNTAEAAVTRLEAMDTLRSYRAENVSMTPDWGRAVILADGVSMGGGLTGRGPVTLPKMTSGKKFYLDLELDDFVTLTGSLEFSSDFTITYDFSWFKLRELTIRNDKKTTIDVTLSGSTDLGPGLQRAMSLTLLRVPVVGQTIASIWMSVALEVTPEGGVSVKFTSEHTETLSYRDGKLSFDKTQPVRSHSISAYASLSIGIKVQPELLLGFFPGCGVSAADVSGSVGVEFKGEISSKTPECTDITVSLYMKISYGMGILGLRKEQKQAIELGKLHYETGKGFVDHCSFLPEQCTVTWYLEGTLKQHWAGGLTTTLDKGAKLEEPVLSSLLVPYFQGWYTDPMFSVAWDFNEPVIRDMTLYPKWRGVTPEPAAEPTPVPDMPAEVDALDYITWETRDEDHVVITGLQDGKTTPRRLTIPSRINGLPVTEIQYRAFSSCQQLQVVTVPGSVKKIGDNAFNNCANLFEVVLQDGVEEIGYYAFAGCRSLCALSLPDSVRVIWSRAFGGDNYLKEFRFPLGIEKAIYPVEGCRRLERIIVPEGVTALPSSALAGVSSKAEVTLPGTLESIGNSAFAGSYFTHIDIPAGVQAISDRAFNGCTELESVGFPAGLKSVGEKAFYGCVKLKELPFPSTVETLGANAFTGCSRLEKLVIPKSLKTFALDDAVTGRENAYNGCESLNEIVIQKGIVDIPPFTFDGAPVKELVFPSTVRKLGEGAISCPNLETLKLNEGLVEIGDKAMCCLGLVRKLKLPSTVRKIGNCVLDGNLTSLTLSRDLEKTDFHLFRFAAYPFLEELIVPEGLEELPDVFGIDECKRLRRVSLPSTLKKIGSGCFAGCTGLQEIRFPDGLREIGSFAFDNCDLLQINLPAGLESIGDCAFQDNRNVSSVFLPDSLKHLGNRAFYRCYSLVEIGYPKGLEDQEVSEPFGLTSWGDQLIRSVVIPEGARRIPAGILKNIGLLRISLPRTLNAIGDDAFSENEIESVTIPENVASIGNAFVNCERLNRLTALCADEVWISAFEAGAFEGSPISRILVRNPSSAAVRAFAEAHGDIIVSVVPDQMAYVTFVNGGLVYETRAVRTGDRAPAVGMPEREGKIFTGWFREPECLTPWNMETDRVQADPLYLYAGWADASFIWEKEGQGIVLRFYTGESKTVRIPEKIGSLPVTALGAGVFGAGVERVIIPAGVTEIDPQAFRFASDLEAVTAEGGAYASVQGVLYRGGEIVCYPAALKGETWAFPETVTAIGAYAFAGNPYLRRLTVPAGVAALGNCAVYGCGNLEEIRFLADPESIGANCMWDCAAGLQVRGPVDAPVLTEYCAANCLQYNLYEVIFMDGGEELGRSREQAGATVGQIYEAPRDGRIFRGWARDAEGTEPWDRENDRMPEEDLTLWAVWAYDFRMEETEGGIRLTEYTGQDTDIHVPETVDGAAVTEIAPGCFGALRPTLHGNRGSVTELFALSKGLDFVPYTYTLAFVTGGGTLADPVTLCATDSVTLPEVIRTGFELEGWYTDAELKQAWPAGRTMPAEDLTLYAAWTRTDPEAKEAEFTFENVPGGIAITGYIGSSDEVDVPAEINGLAVTAIADGAFAGNDLPRSVTLPDSVRTLGSGAFRNCGALVTVHLPAGLKDIPANAFDGCEWLTVINLPDTLESIGAYAFHDCRSLPAAELGSAVENIDPTAFRGCVRLAEITVAGGNLYYSSADGVLFNADGTTLMLYPEGKRDAEYTVPEGTERIRENAMQGARFGKLSLNAGLRSIGAGAVQNAPMLAEIAFSAGLAEIGADAFSGCGSLREADLPESLETLGARAFHLCPLIRLAVGSGTQLSEGCVDAAEELTIFGATGSPAQDYADEHGIRFQDPQTDIPLESMALPDALTMNIGETRLLTPVLTPENAFTGRLDWSSGDQSVATVSEEGEVLARGRGITTVTVKGPGGISASCSVTVVYDAVMPESVTFRDEVIVMAPGEVRSIELEVLPADTRMPDKEFNWSTDDPEIAVVEKGCVKALAVGKTGINFLYGFTQSCTLIVSESKEYEMMYDPDFILPASLREIEDYAFAGTDVRGVYIPNTVTRIGDYAFAGCENLEEIYIPPTCTEIGEHAFDGCPSDMTIYCYSLTEADYLSIRLQCYVKHVDWEP